MTSSLDIHTNPARVRSYGIRQMWILVPGAVVAFWAAAALRRRR